MGTAVALLVLALVPALGVGVAGAAPVQETPEHCLPGSSIDYPATPGATALEPLRLDGGHFTPGGTGWIDISGAREGIYCGIAYSTPILLPNMRAQAGKLMYRNFAVPADFELNAMHHIDIYKLQVKVGNFDFCVDRKGDIAPTSACKATAVAGKPGKLARTGQDHLMELVRIAILVIGLGAGALYLRRRQTTRAA